MFWFQFLFLSRSLSTISSNLSRWLSNFRNINWGRLHYSSKLFHSLMALKYFLGGATSLSSCVQYWDKGHQPEMAVFLALVQEKTWVGRRSHHVPALIWPGDLCDLPPSISSDLFLASACSSLMHLLRDVGAWVIECTLEAKNSSD